MGAITRLISNDRRIIAKGSIAPNPMASAPKTIASDKPIGHCVRIKNQAISTITRLPFMALRNFTLVRLKGTCAGGGSGTGTWCGSSTRASKARTCASRDATTAISPAIIASCAELTVPAIPTTGPTGASGSRSTRVPSRGRARSPARACIRPSSTCRLERTASVSGVGDCSALPSLRLAMPSCMASIASSSSRS